MQGQDKESKHEKRKDAIKRPSLMAESDFRKGGTPAGY